MAAEGNKPHVVCIPIPLQSHIKAMLKLAKLFHHRGFHVTFVNTEFNHNRFLQSLGPNSLDGFPDFRFKTIPDGLPVTSTDEDNTSQDIVLLLQFILEDLLPPFCNLLRELNDPPVTCIVSDGLIPSTITAAQELGIPIAMFFTISASAFMCPFQYPALMEKGLTPLKDESCFTNGFMDAVIDWIPGMKGIRLRELSTVLHTTDPNDIFFKLSAASMDGAQKASAVVVHSFDALEQDVLDGLSSMLIPPIYAIGPLELLLNQLPEDHLKPMGYNLWKEENECIDWLESKLPNSVVYVNFGSLAVMSPELVAEFGWGLANTNYPFLWIIRPNLVVGESAVLPPGFLAEIKERGMLVSWCSQEKVLSHPSVGGFLTHSGWNSIIESLSVGVPMICWPLFADQPTNSWCTCNEWGSGMEMDKDVNKGKVEKIVRELMEGEKGMKMKDKAMDWKRLAEEATGPHGSSSKNLDNLANQMLAKKI